MDKNSPNATLMRASEYHCGRDYTLKIGDASLAISKNYHTLPVAILNETGYASKGLQQENQIKKLDGKETQVLLAGIESVEVASDYGRIPQNTISSEQALAEINVLIQKAKENNK
jgi:hypothetical protein